MRRFVLALLLAAVVAAGLAARAPSLAAQPVLPAIGKLTLDSVAEWRAQPCAGQPSWATDTCGGLLVSNNAGGELRLADGATSVVYTTAPITTTLLYNAVGATWQADVPVSTTLTLEIRGGTSPREEDLSPWQPLLAGDALSQNDGAPATESALAFPAGMAVLQLRATLASSAPNTTPVLSAITLHYVDATRGPSRVAAPQRVPAPYGPATLTSPPAVALRESWGAPAVANPAERQRPRGVVLHQIGSDDVVSAPTFLRALAAYHTQVLGWDDLPYHFVVDREGTVYVGRNGGPTAALDRFNAGDSAIHVALIGAGAPPSAQQEALVKLLAWIGQAYQIAPLGTHNVAVKDAAPVKRANIVTHAEIVATASDPSAALRGQIGALREAADRETVRARWYFAEGNPFNFAERLAVLNPSGGPASVRFTLLRQPGPAVVRDDLVAAGGRTDLVVNNLFADTSEAPAVIESNAPVIAERFMNFGNDISSTAGVRQPSRVWYFAEGSTTNNRKTYLLLFNPRDERVAATITYMLSRECVGTQTVTVPPRQRAVITVADADVEVACLQADGKVETTTQKIAAGFGVRVVAAAPIIAERTMIFGAGSTANSGGVHSAPGMTSLSRQWYFAEGTTQAPFSMSILVLNPNAQPANVAVKFLTDSGTSLTRSYAIPPLTRLELPVNEVVPELGIATTVTADRPVAVERALYWKSEAAGTAGPGATAPAYTWRFADGRTADQFQEYLLLSNPGVNQARVTVEFVLANGSKSSQSVIMPKESRYTMAVHQLYPGQAAISATVRSTQPIVAERSLYLGAPGAADSKGGATALGVAEDLP